MKKIWAKIAGWMTSLAGKCSNCSHILTYMGGKCSQGAPRRPLVPLFPWGETRGNSREQSGPASDSAAARAAYEAPSEATYKAKDNGQDKGLTKATDKAKTNDLTKQGPKAYEGLAGCGKAGTAAGDGKAGTNGRRRWAEGATGGRRRIVRQGLDGRLWELRVATEAELTYHPCTLCALGGSKSGECLDADDRLLCDSPTLGLIELNRSYLRPYGARKDGDKARKDGKPSDKARKDEKPSNKPSKGGEKPGKGGKA